LNVRLAAVIGTPSVTVPEGLPKMASSGVALFQIAVPPFQDRLVVFHVPLPPFQVKLAAQRGDGIADKKSIAVARIAAA
jgi:hypothetical protein